jgi:hypothetical protein
MKATLFTSVFFAEISQGLCAPNKDAQMTNRNPAVVIGLNNGKGSDGHNGWTSWINGYDPCVNGMAHTLGVYQPSNPCSHKFYISGIAGALTFEGCGGNSWVNQDGNRVGDCHWAPKKLN